MENWPPKKVRHTLGNLESGKQVYFGYRVKNRRIGAAGLTSMFIIICIVIAFDGMHSRTAFSLFCLFFCEVAVGVGGSDTL